jgi:hypothetical protein
MHKLKRAWQLLRASNYILITDVGGGASVSPLYADQFLAKLADEREGLVLARHRHEQDSGSGAWRAMTKRRKLPPDTGGDDGQFLDEPCPSRHPAARRTTSTWPRRGRTSRRPGRVSRMTCARRSSGCGRRWRRAGSRVRCLVVRGTIKQVHAQALWRRCSPGLVNHKAATGRNSIAHPVEPVEERLLGRRTGREANVHVVLPPARHRRW